MISCTCTSAFWRNVWLTDCWIETFARIISGKTFNSDLYLFPVESPNFGELEAPLIFMLSKHFWRFTSLNLNTLIRHLIIQPFSCCKQLVSSVFLIVYKSAKCIFMKFENWPKQLMRGLEHQISRDYTAESGERCWSELAILLDEVLVGCVEA